MLLGAAAGADPAAAVLLSRPTALAMRRATEEPARLVDTAVVAAVLRAGLRAVVVDAAGLAFVAGLVLVTALALGTGLALVTAFATGWALATGLA